MLITVKHAHNIHAAVTQHIDKHASHTNKRKRVLLLDIDDTALITTVSLKHLYRQHVTYKIYQHALRKGIPVVFLTARRHSCFSYLWTLHQLYSLGYTRIRKLLLMPRSFRSVSLFKSHVRERIGKPNILVNMGDQWGDFFCPVEDGLCHYTDQVHLFTDPSLPQTLNVKLPSA
jgi:predicted secreted acid phosphatase